MDIPVRADHSGDDETLRKSYVCERLLEALQDLRMV